MTMKAEGIDDKAKLENLFRLLFVIQSSLEHFAVDKIEYQAELDEIMTSVDELITKMIQDHESHYFI
jgi:tRNA(Ser,Leu) C12 N-acetylase TAN1